MKINTIQSILILVLSSFIIFGCEKNEDVVTLKGEMVGFVKLIDESNIEQNDKSGVTVAIENADYSAVTDENGRFELEDVPAGTYNLIYSKEGFGTVKQFSYQFIGGNMPALVGTIKIYQQPTIEIRSLDYNVADEILTITGTLSKTPDQLRILFCFNDSSNVSLTNFDYGLNLSITGFSMNGFNWSFYLNQYPFYNSKVYLVIYFVNIAEEFGYYDYEKKTYVFSSAVKASNVIEIKLW